MEFPSVSIIIPCRNEKKFIGQCLDSIIANNYPKEKLEIFVIDGMSNDGTREIVEKYREKDSFINLLDNQKKIAASALNIGIKKSKNEIIIRMDAHAEYKNDYIKKCVFGLEKYNAENIGGVWEVVSRENTIIGRGIAASLSSFLGSGDAYYKTGAKKLIIADTVPFGCFKRNIFEKIGFFNENLERSQDFELNLRLKNAGGKICLLPEIVGYYYPRSTLREFFVHNFKDGIWAIYPLKFVKIPFKARHYMPLVFVTTLLFFAVLGIFVKEFFLLFLFEATIYGLCIFYFSTKIVIKNKDPMLFFSLPTAFVVRHFAYGFGSLFGVIKLLC